MMANEVQYLRNEKGQISMMPLVAWHIENYGRGLLLQVNFAETPEDFEKGDLAVVQMAVSAEYALRLGAELTKVGNDIIASQMGQMANKPVQ
jgi:hypothetical protein